MPRIAQRQSDFADLAFHQQGVELDPILQAPFPRTPLLALTIASVNVLLRHQQKGDISNELTMGTFLMRFDTPSGSVLTIEFACSRVVGIKATQSSDQLRPAVNSRQLLQCLSQVLSPRGASLPFAGFLRWAPRGASTCSTLDRPPVHTPNQGLEPAET
jgi:hypothetical protein